MVAPSRGDVWLADLSPIRGHEQAGRRPVLVVSVDAFNHGPAELALVLPMTSKIRPFPSWVVVQPPEGGVDRPSAILCEAIRSVARERLVTRWGQVSATTMARAEDSLRILLDL